MSNTWNPLTPREIEVWQQVGLGKSNREIAATLSISEQTVKNHLHSIFPKLAVTNRKQIAVLWSEVEAQKRSNA